MDDIYMSEILRQLPSQIPLINLKNGGQEGKTGPIWDGYQWKREGHKKKVNEDEYAHVFCISV
jgi:hypothetical protein